MHKEHLPPKFLLSYGYNQSFTNILLSKPVLIKNFYFFCYFVLILFLFVLPTGCGKVDPGHWIEFTPESTPYLILPEEGTTINQMLEAPYIPLFDDITPSAIQLTGDLRAESASSSPVEAVLLFPDTANDWQPVWITRGANGFLSRLTEEYQLPYEQNSYDFKSHTIEKLFLTDRTFYAVNLGSWLVFSESSFGIESMLRTLAGEEPSISLTESQLQRGSFVVNIENLDRWIQQVAQVSYRPDILGAFKGGAPVLLTLNQPSEDDEWLWQLSGSMPLNEPSRFSPLLESITAPAEEFDLDRYIPANAAAFSIHRIEPSASFGDSTASSSDTDRYLEDNAGVAENLSESLDPEIAFATFAESGPSSDSEFLFLRKLNNPERVRDILNQMVEEELVVRDENTYAIQSSRLAKLFGSALNSMSDFYLTLYEDAAALALRKGLAESIVSDANRRRVVFYEDQYSKVRGSLPDPLSFILYVDAPRFSRYIQPWLYPQNYFGLMASNLNQLVVSGNLQPNRDRLDIQITSFQQETSSRPYEEQWLFPLGDSDLAGAPVLANITGSARNEVIFSTEEGSVYVLASDGTTILQTSTSEDRPLGSPVVYDWYGNSQQVIMQAAGNKIYAWNNTGNSLPGFPVFLNESITTPLMVSDVTRNGIAEMVVATADRQLHILNARGQELSGWPQSTNSVLSSPPLVTDLNGRTSVFAFAENALHGWSLRGQRRDGFPVFLPAQVHGSPFKFNDHLLGAGRDGSLYAIGTERLFTNTLSSVQSDDPLMIQSLSVSNSSLNATPSSYNLLMRDENQEFYREDLILLQSSNGSLFMYNSTGKLLFTQTMGQPSSGNSPPFVTDIDQNERNDVLALAGFGRLYGWDHISGDRLYDLPTAGMNHIVVDDLYGDGRNEIIAQSRDGLQCWTILRTRRSSGE